MASKTYSEAEILAEFSLVIVLVLAWIITKRPGRRGD